MRIVTLIENTSHDPSLVAEHGLSLYIETGDHKILFDAGASGAFADNARMLGVDLRAVDFAILSHGHSDHSGGLLRFLQINDHAPIYASRHVFGGQCNADGVYIGPDPALRGRMQLVDSLLQLAPGITLECPEEAFGTHPLDTAGLQICKDGVLYPEDFRHEQYLKITEAGKTILFSGCSHRGILNIAQTWQPDVLIGGFHFMKRDPQSLLPDAQALLATPTCYYTGHCTGQAQYDFLQNVMSDRLHYLSTGTKLAL